MRKIGDRTKLAARTIYTWHPKPRVALLLLLEMFMLSRWNQISLRSCFFQEVLGASEVNFVKTLEKGVNFFNM